MEQVQYQAATFAPLSEAYLVDQKKYTVWISKQSLNEIISPIGASGKPYDPFLGSRITRLFFWEKIRIERLLKTITVDHHHWLKQMENSPVKLSGDPTSGSLTRTTDLPKHSWGRELLNKDSVKKVHELALRLKLALSAYQADHGAFPENLEQLQEKYLPQLPVDPWKGQQFQYFTELEDDSHAYLLNIRAGGHLTVLWPPANSGWKVIAPSRRASNSPQLLVLKNSSIGVHEEQLLKTNHRSSPTKGYLFFVP